MHAHSEDILNLIMSHPVRVAQQASKDNLVHHFRCKVNSQLISHLLEFISAQAADTQLSILVKQVREVLSRLSDGILQSFNTDCINTFNYLLNQVDLGEVLVSSDLPSRAHLAHVTHEVSVVLLTEFREVFRP